MLVGASGVTEDALALAIGRKIQAWCREEPGRTITIEVHADRHGQPRKLERPKMVRETLVLSLTDAEESVESM